MRKPRIKTRELGNKIRMFRERFGISQLALEAMINMSPGNLSRIENGAINPTKETVYVISKALALPKHEIMYILGINSEDPTSEEIEGVLEIVKPLLSQPSFYGYLLDKQSRIVMLSKGFHLLAAQAGINSKVLEGKHVAQIIFDPELGIRGIIPSETFPNLAASILAVLTQDKSYMSEELWFKQLVAQLRKMPGFEEVWQQLKHSRINLYEDKYRRAAFIIGGKKIHFKYSFTYLNEDPRFRFIEFTPLR